MSIFLARVNKRKGRKDAKNAKFFQMYALRPLRLRVLCVNNTEIKKTDIHPGSHLR